MAKRGLSSFAGSGLFLTVLLTGFVAIGQDSLKEAQRLYRENKFDEAIKALDKELSKPNASLELMKLGIEANLKAGRPVSANILITELLKQNKTLPPEIMLKAAEVAEMCGDTELASARYYSYLTTNREKSAGRTEAASYLIRNASYAEALIARSEDVGPEFLGGSCLGQLERALRNGDTVNAAALVRYMTKTYAENPTFIADMMRTINMNRTNLSKDDQIKLLNALMSTPLPEDQDKSALWELMRVQAKQFTYGPEYKVGMTYMDLNKTAVPDEFFLTPVNQALETRQGAVKKNIAEEAIKYAPYFEATKNKEVIKSWILSVARHADAYKDLVKPVDFARWLQKYADLTVNNYPHYPESGRLVGEILNFYQGNTGKQVEFLKAALPNLDVNGVNNLLTRNSSDAKNVVNSWLSAASNAFQKQLREAQLIERYRLMGNKKQMLAALQNALTYGDGDARVISGEVNSTFLSPAEAVSAVSNAVAKGGVNPLIQAVTGNMERNRNISGNSSFGALKQAVKQQKSGSDAVLSQAAKVMLIPARKENHKAIAAAAKGFFKTYKGAIASGSNTAASAEEYAAYRVLSHYLAAANYSYETAAPLVQYLSRVNGPGPIWGNMGFILQRLEGNNHKGRAFHAYTMEYGRMMKNNPKAVWEFSQNLGRFWLCPPQKDECAMLPVLDRDPALTVDYFRQNSAEWSFDYFCRAAQAFLYSSKTDLVPWKLHEFMNLVLARGKKEALPMPLRKAMLAKLTESEKKYKTVESDLVFRTIFDGPGGGSPELVDRFVQDLKKRSAYQQVAILNDCIGEKTDRKSGMLLAASVMRPLLSTWNQQQWKKISVSKFFAAFFRDAARDSSFSEADRKLAQDICTVLSVTNLKGETVTSQDRGLSQMHEILADEFVKLCSGNPDNKAVAGAVSALMDSLQYEDNERRGMDTARKIGQVVDKMPPQIQYVLYSRMTSGTSNFHKSAKNSYLMKLSQLGKSIPGVIPVPPSDPAYQLFLAAKALSDGNALEAWRLLRPKYALLAKRWKNLDYDFVIWGLEMGRKQKMFKDALELGMTLWLDEQHLEPEAAARLGLIKGDIYRDMKNFPAARIEYESLNNSGRYVKTESGQKAKFRLVELLILTQDYTTARQMLERLTDSSAVSDQAEAYYLLARMEFEQKEYEQADEYLKQVFKRVHTHVDGRLLKGELDLAMRNFSDTSIEIGPPELNTIVVPGKEINFQIQDNNLSIVRGGKAIPIVISTSEGKDQEKIELLPSPNDNTLFAGKIMTSLGKAKPGNLLLEVNGNDSISYQIDPEFQKANNLHYEAKKLEIKSPAKLFISSKKILSEAEQEEMKMADGIMISAGRSRVGSSKIIRPGSPFNIQVIDPDMSVNTDAPDKVFVTVTSSSGDEIKDLPLIETGNSTGVFQAKVETGIPFPHATASDQKEGNDVNAVINSTKNGTWISQADATSPKWLEVDTMTSFNFKKVRIVLPNKENIKKFRLTGALDEDETVICNYPMERGEESRGGLNIRKLSGNEGRRQQIENRFRRTSGATSWVQSPNYTNRTPRGQRDSWYIMEMSGSFWLEKNEEIEFKFLQKPRTQQMAFLVIDGEQVLGGQMNESGVMMTRTMFLPKGLHSIKILVRDMTNNSSVIVGRAESDGTYQPLPEGWFRTDKHPEFAQALKPKGRLVEKKDGFEVILNEPMRCRKLKCVFDKFAGNFVEVSKIYAEDDTGKQILPVPQDLSTGKNNNILEIASGDKVVAVYNDDKRLDDNKAVLNASLQSSFHDATINLCYEEVRLDDDGVPRTTLTAAKRVQKGDSLVLVVRDSDEDTEDGPQTIKAQISTSSGEKLTLDLLKDERETSEFKQVFKTGDKTGGETIRIQSGDIITATYLDKENNRPGIAVNRTTTVQGIEGSKPEIVVYKTTLHQIEDRSAAAQNKIRQMRDKGDKRENIKIYKDEILATPVRLPKNADPNKEIDINSKAPLLLEIIYPEVAKHMGSKAEVTILTETEINAAKAEGREPKPLVVQAPVKPLSSLAREKGYPVVIPGKNAQSAREILDNGQLAAVVRLQLGAIGDELNDAVTSNDNFNILNSAGRTEQDSFKVPTVIVSGSEKIVVAVNDKDGKPVAQRVVRLKSNGELELFDKNFLTPQDSVHIGQSFYVRVYDPDRDISGGLDTVDVWVQAKSGDQQKLTLSETLPHSGVFTGVLKTEMQPKAGPDGSIPKKAADTIRTTFGDELTFRYTDEIPLEGNQPVKVVKTGRIILGSDAEVATFTKSFKDPDMAVKTNFLMAEALFEMAKSHRQLKKDDLAKEEISRGKRILEEALRDYPNTSLKAQGEFLLANLAQQLENYQEAIGRYAIVLSSWPNSEYAVKSQFQKAQCLEKMGPDHALQACEEYVKLTYLYPDSSLAADAKLRLANFYYKNKKYKSAAMIFRKFAENHSSHALACKSMFLAGQSELRYQKFLEEKSKDEKLGKNEYRANYEEAIKTFKDLLERFADDSDIRAETMYWLGDSYFKQSGADNQEKSYQMFKKLTWDYPESIWAKRARARLVEQESN